MSEEVVLKSRVDKVFRKRFNNTATMEECTYEELLRLLMEFRDDHKEEWDSWRRASHGRRPAGTGDTGT